MWLAMGGLVNWELQECQKPQYMITPSCETRVHDDIAGVQRRKSV